jgi:hypothetical protein
MRRRTSLLLSAVLFLLVLSMVPWPAFKPAEVAPLAGELVAPLMRENPAGGSEAGHRPGPQLAAPRA